MHSSGKFCGQVDHAYVQVTAMWCPHEQRWTLWRTVFVDGAADEVDMRRDERLDLGPFDDQRDALAALARWLEDDLAGVRS
jgi:hypothetical protein